MSSRRDQKQQARLRRLELEAALRERDRRKRRRAGLAATAAMVLALGGGIAAIVGGADHPDQTPALPAGKLTPLATLGKLKSAGRAGVLGPEDFPVPDGSQLTTDPPARGNSTVDGIACQRDEQVLFHIHAHVSLFVDGGARRIPYGIGIPGARVSTTPAGPYVAAGSCFYWLHTHAADGLVHIESPLQRTYTLGNFFDVWGEKLTPTQVGPATGTVTAFYDGQVYRGDPREIPLTKHAQIQLDVGQPLIAPVMISFPAGL